MGLGRYGFTLTILSSESHLSAPDEEEDEDAELEKFVDSKIRRQAVNWDFRARQRMWSWLRR